MNNPTTSPRSFEQIKQHLSQSILSLQKPSDLIITLIYCIPILAPVRICTETGIFHQLSASSTPLSADTLAKTLLPRDHPPSDTGPAASTYNDGTRDFVVRMLRAVCALGLVDEVAEFTYAANELTRAMADDGFVAGFEMVWDNLMGPKSTLAEMVTFHRGNGWRVSESAVDGPWQRARDSVGTSTFDSWVASDPLQLTRLSKLMQRMQSERVHWTEWFPGENIFVNNGKVREEFIFVDVGGGRGHDLMALANRYPRPPQRTDRFVLEDLPSVLAEAEAERTRTGQVLDPRIEAVPRDFFQNSTRPYCADIYYLHKILHDWPDDDCVRILTNPRDGMDKDSRIFVNEVILPNRGCSLLEAAFDIDMLALHSGQERDEAMWKRLIERVPGLSIREFWKPPDGHGEGIVEIVISDDE